MRCERPPRGRLARLFDAADRRHVALRTILITVGVVVATYLGGKLMYLLRDVVLLMLVAGFVTMLLNPAVAKVQRRVTRRVAGQHPLDDRFSRSADAPARRRSRRPSPRPDRTSRR